MIILVLLSILDKTTILIMDNRTPPLKKGYSKGLLVILLLISIGFNCMQYNWLNALQVESREQVQGLESEAIKFEKLYGESMSMVDAVKTENKSLTQEIKSKVLELRKVKEDIEHIRKTVKNKNELNKRLQKKYKEAVAINKDLEDKIDDLLVENKTLFDKNENLEKNVQVLNEEKIILGAKVGVGERLKAEYFSTVLYKKRSSGKYKETRLAKRVNKIEVNFALLDNEIAKQGQKLVYLRIVAPTGKVLGNPIMGSDEFKFERATETLKYSVKKEFTYTGEKQNIMVFHEETSIRFEPGAYTVEIYVDSYLAGTSTLSMR